MEKPVKSLSKIFEGTLKNTGALQTTADNLGIWLTGKWAWNYLPVHGSLHQLHWPLLVVTCPLPPQVLQVKSQLFSAVVTMPTMSSSVAMPCTGGGTS